MADQPQGETEDRSIQGRLSALHQEDSETPTEEAKEDDELTPGSEDQGQEQADEEDVNEESEETPKEDLEEDSEDITEEEALANAKNPERTKKYIEKLKARQSQPPQKPQASVFDNLRNPQGYQGVESQQVQQLANANQYENLEQQDINKILQDQLTQDENGNPIVNLDGLAKAIQVAQDQAIRRAEQRAHQISRQHVEQLEESQEVQELVAEFPELNPRSKDFDTDFNDMLTDKILRGRYYNGEKTRAVDYARQIAKFRGRSQAAKEAVKAQTASTPVGPIERGKGSRRAKVSTDDLRRGQWRGGRRGDKATEERMRRAGLL